MATIRRILENVFHPCAENKLNKLYQARTYNSSRPIYVFYHIYAVNNWRVIVDSQIQALKSSGLYAQLSKLFVSVICYSQEDFSYIHTICGEKCVIIYQGSDASVYEFPALRALKSMCNREDCYCLYLHTKGSSNSSKTLKWYYPRVKNLEQLRRNSKAWRLFMEYFNIHHWRLALAVLTDYDTYGCYYKIQEDRCWYYAGNFWWTKSEYVRTLDAFSATDTTYRYSAETWLLRRDTHYYDACRLNSDLTAIELPGGLYDGHCGLRKSLWGGVFSLRYVRFKATMTARFLVHRIKKS